jgi:hypothetical protein
LLCGVSGLILLLFDFIKFLLILFIVLLGCLLIGLRKR